MTETQHTGRHAGQDTGQDAELDDVELDDVAMEAEMEQARQSGRASGSGPAPWAAPGAGRRPGAGRIVLDGSGPADEYEAPGQDRGEDRGGSGGRGPGVHARLRAAVGELRFASERPASLRDHVAWARLGRWTPRADGRVRHLALLWAYTVAIPVTTAAYLAVWSVSRGPARAAAVWGTAAVLGTALNGIPVVEWLLPDWFSLTAWPPLSWLSGQ